MALLLFSPKCQYSMEIHAFIKSNPQLGQIVRYHDVSALGVPPQYQGKITHVPTMLTQNGKFLVGKEIRQWLSSLLPAPEITTCQLGGWGGSIASLDGNDDSSDLFDLNMYGQSLQPAMTPEIEQKISQSVNDAYSQTIKK